MKRSTKIVLGIGALMAALVTIGACSGTSASGGSQEIPVAPATTTVTNTITATTTATVTVTETSTPAAVTVTEQLVPSVPAPSPEAATTTPAPPPTPATTTTTQAQQAAAEPAGAYYGSCAEAKAAGAAPLHVGEPGYRSGLDRDHDGVACE